MNREKSRFSYALENKEYRWYITINKEIESMKTGCGCGIILFYMFGGLVLAFGVGIWVLIILLIIKMNKKDKNSQQRK